MSAALELIRAVEANGGRFRVDGEYLVIAPGGAAAPVMEELRQHKTEIIGLLKSAAIPPHDPAEWREDFARWMAEDCIHRAGREDSAGIGPPAIQLRGMVHRT